AGWARRVSGAFAAWRSGASSQSTSARRAPQPRAHPVRRPIMSHDALRSILPIAGWAPEETERRARAVEFTGGTDPILPTPFRISETGAATLAATGIAAADLWELRSGRKQDVAVNVRQATASLRSGHYMHFNDSAVSHERNKVMGVYPAKNGRWSYI